MARKEWTPENWKWDEEKIRKYLEEFEKYLNSKEGQDILEKRREKLKMAQELLKDEESIESLTSEKLSALLKMTDASRGNKRPVLIIEKGDEEYFKEFKAWLKNLINVKLQDPLPEKKPGDVSTGYATELLTLRNPKEFYLINNASIDGLRKLGFGKLPSNDEKSYPKWRPLFDELKEKIKKIVEKNLDKEVDYYDVDNFLYFVREQYKKSEKNKSDESQDKNRESSNIAEVGKKLESEKQTEVSKLTLQQYFQYKGFYFDQDLITAFYSALKTKGFVILSGLTGTGKTKLAQLFAEIFEIEKIKEKSDENYSSIVVSVSPSWIQYSRINIPKRYNEILNLVDTETGKYVKVIGGNEEENCKIVKRSKKRDSYTLLLRGKVAKWFKDNFKEKDELKIEVMPTGDNENVILVLKKFEPDKIEIEKKPAYLFLSVRPDWRDSKALLGYYNPITENYESTNLLKFFLEAIENYNTKKDNADPCFIILDEMNLSHVEYYFADFLSVLESGRDENYWTKEAIKLHSYDNSEEPLLDNNEDEISNEIKLPPNLYIIGSVNIDETTYMFSPKVLDRAFAIEFREVNFDKYLASMQNGQINISEDELKKLLEPLRDELLKDLRNNGKFCAVVADKNEIKNAINELDPAVKAELNQLNQILQLYDLHFGYRVLDEIALFIKYETNAPDKVGKLEKEQALDFAVFMKVLPKFHGPRQKLERPLWLVLKWCLRNDVEFDNKTFDDLIKGIWKKLNDEEKRPNIEDLTYVIQDLKSSLNSKKDENQNQTTEESPESTSEAHQTEQTSKEEKVPIIDKFKYPRTAIKVLTMLRQLYETGFTSFA